MELLARTKFKKGRSCTSVQVNDLLFLPLFIYLFFLLFPKLVHLFWVSQYLLVWQRFLFYKPVSICILKNRKPSIYNSSSTSTKFLHELWYSLYNFISCMVFPHMMKPLASSRPSQVPWNWASHCHTVVYNYIWQKTSMKEQEIIKDWDI